MARDVNEIINALPAARRRKIEKKANILRTEEMTLAKRRADRSHRKSRKVREQEKR